MAQLLTPGKVYPVLRLELAEVMGWATFDALAIQAGTALDGLPPRSAPTAPPPIHLALSPAEVQFAGVGVAKEMIPKAWAAFGSTVDPLAGFPTVMVFDKAGIELAALLSKFMADQLTRAILRSLHMVMPSDPILTPEDRLPSVMGLMEQLTKELNQNFLRKKVEGNRSGGL